jgi:hypothetical protein
LRGDKEFVVGGKWKDEGVNYKVGKDINHSAFSHKH